MDCTCLNYIDHLYLSVLKSRLVLTDTNLHLHCLCVCPGAGCESVMRAELRGDSRGAASSRPHTVLFQALQRPRPFTASSQHSLRFQGEPGNRPAGGFHTGTQGTVPLVFFFLHPDFILELTFIVCVIRAHLDQILPLFMLIWSPYVMTGQTEGSSTKTDPITGKIKHWCLSGQTNVFFFCLSIRVRLVEKGAPQSLSLMESGTVSVEHKQCSDWPPEIKFSVLQ